MGRIVTLTTGSKCRRAKDAGWDDDESDSDEDITGAPADYLAQAVQVCTAFAPRALMEECMQCAPPSHPRAYIRAVQGDLRALDAAMSDAAKLVADLRLQGREKQAAELESLMRAETDSDDSGSDSDEVDCEQLD